MRKGHGRIWHSCHRLPGRLERLGYPRAAEPGLCSQTRTVKTTVIFAKSTLSTLSRAFTDFAQRNTQLARKSRKNLTARNPVPVSTSNHSGFGDLDESLFLPSLWEIFQKRAFALFVPFFERLVCGQCR
jgi:hypothetical protein